MYRAHSNADALTTPAEGWCLTDDEIAAGHYGCHIATLEIDLDSLTVERVAGYDRDENETPADSAAFRAAAAARGVDVVIYSDETERGREHATYRLVSERAVAAVRVVSID